MSDLDFSELTAQLAAYGEAVQTTFDPDYRHRSEIDPRRNGTSPQHHEDVTDSADLTARGDDDRPRRGLLILAAAVIVALVLGVTAMLTSRRQSNVIADNPEVTSTTTTTVPDRSSRAPATTQAPIEGAPDGDAGSVPSPMRLLSESSSWLPVQVSWLDLSVVADESPIEQPPLEFVAYRRDDVLAVLRVDIGEAQAGDVSSAAAAPVTRFGGNSADVSWSADGNRMSSWVVALGQSELTLGDADVKEIAEAWQLVGGDWVLPSAEFVDSVRRESTQPSSGPQVEIRYALRVDGGLDTVQQVRQSITQGDPTEIYQALHEAASSGVVRMLRTSDDQPGFIVDGDQIYAMSVHGDYVSTVQGVAPSEAVIDLLTTVEAVDQQQWDETWERTELLEMFELPAMPKFPRLLPGSDWRVLTATDPSLWSEEQQRGYLLDISAGSNSATVLDRWIQTFRPAALSADEPPEIGLTVLAAPSETNFPFMLCDDGAQAVVSALSSESCGLNRPNGTSTLLARGDGWYVSVQASELSFDELVRFVEHLEARQGDPLIGFEVSKDSGYTLVHDEPVEGGVLAGSSVHFTSDVGSVWLSMIGTPPARVALSDIVMGDKIQTAGNIPRLVHRDGSWLSWYDESTELRVSVSSEAGFDVSLEFVEELRIVDEEVWTSVIKPVNRESEFSIPMFEEDLGPGVPIPD